jgi:hypothetical protein
VTSPADRRFAPNFLLERFANPLDPGFADAAAARRRNGPRPRWRRAGAAALRTVTLQVVGLVAVAGGHTQFVRRIRPGSVGPRLRWRGR